MLLTYNHKNTTTAKEMKNYIPFYLTTFFLAMLITIACKGDDSNIDSSGEVVYFNGKIYTVNPDQVWAEAMLVEDGVIKYVGTDEEAKKMASEAAAEVDLGGKMVMPGIHDVHMHPLEAASENYKFIFDENVTDPENFASEITTANNNNTGTGWLLGWGHSLEVLLEAQRAPKEILDDISTERPIGIMEMTSHSLWCNSKALELLGFTASSPNPIGGIIMKEPNGEPNGILIDNAGELLMALALSPTVESMENDYAGLVEYALPEMAKYGITSFSEARTYWKRNQQDTWKKIEADGELTVRAHLGLWVYPSEEDASQLVAIKALYSNDENSLLKINQIKLYADGIIHNTTAAMHDDYLIDYFDEPTNNGLNYLTEARIADYISDLEPVGFDFHIHALGNRAVHESLNAIEQSGTANGRHRLTHVEFVDPSDYPRFAALNVIADAQVAGDFTDPAHWHENDYLVGSQVTNAIIPLKSLKENNARITLSSDWDVSTLNPFVGMHNAVSRSPQNLSLEEVVKAYTINAAYAMRHEHKVGSLETGKEADFIILDKNIFEIPANEINTTKVLQTFLQGESVFKK
ncbi:MAG: putative amidohydrolase YtcJ [Polaribacter sp.]